MQYVPGKKCQKLQEGGGASPIFTDAFLEQIKNNLENLLDTKVFNVTKDLSQKLGARQKRDARAKAQKLDIWSN